MFESEWHTRYEIRSKAVVKQFYEITNSSGMPPDGRYSRTFKNCILLFYLVCLLFGSLAKLFHLQCAIEMDYKLTAMWFLAATTASRCVSRPIACGPFRNRNSQYIGKILIMWCKICRVAKGTVTDPMLATGLVVLARYWMTINSQC